MAIRIHIGSVEVSFDPGDNLTEVAKVVEALRERPQRPEVPAPAKKSLGEVLKTKLADAKLREIASMPITDTNELFEARKFLLAIQPTADGPAGAEQLIKAFGLGHGKAIGPLSARVGKTIANLGFDPKTLYASKKAGKSRVWQTSPKINDVILAIESQLAPE